MKLIMDEQAISRAVARISYEIIEKNKGAEGLCIVGILSRGAALKTAIAEKIEQVEGKKLNVGVLDITRFRDDKKICSDTDRTEIDFEIEGKTIVLVDDVLFTGRTVRAAIDALLSRGRPKSIQLAVLIDRGHRELPFRADYVGKNLPTSSNELVKVNVKEFDGENCVVIVDKGENK